MKYSQRVAIFLKGTAFDNVSFEKKKFYGNFQNYFGNDICINLISSKNKNASMDTLIPADAQPMWEVNAATTNRLITFCALHYFGN